MPMNLYLLIALAAAALLPAAFYVHLKLRNARTPSPALADRIRSDGREVQCFSCGDWVPRETALEKKGRYFCGVKKGEREARRQSPRNS